MSSKDLRLDLTLIKKYVSALEEKLEAVYVIRDTPSSGDQKEKYLEFMLELSHAVGILSSLGQETMLLITDCNNVAKYSQPTLQEKPADAGALLSSILSKNKFNGDN